MWMLVGVILQIGPVSSPPATLQWAFASEAARGDAKNDLERNTAGIRRAIGYDLLLAGA
jgi:hypothetical protein